MVWLIVGLLFVIVFLLGWILVLLGQVAELSVTLVRHASANLNELQQTRSILENIEGRTERMTEPFHNRPL